MRVDIGTASGTGQISNTSDIVMVIEFHARSKNDGLVYVGLSDVSDNNGRELAAGETYALNFASAYEIDRRHPEILMSQFYVQVADGDKVDWSAIFRS